MLDSDCRLIFMATDFLIIDLKGSDESQIDDAIHAAQEWVDRTYNEIQLSEEIQEPDSFVFRLGSSFSWRLSQSSQKLLLAELRNCLDSRFEVEDADIFILYSSHFEIKLVCENETRSAEQLFALIEKLRTYELKEMAFNSGALYHNSGTYLFEHPSGEISDFFFRAGNIQSNFEELEKLWFWTIPYLKNVRYIVCDTWSISTLGAYIATKLPVYDASIKNVRWNYLRGYIGDDAGLNQDLAIAFKNASTNRKQILFLLSASASGRSYRSIGSVGAAEGFAASRYSILTLFALSEKVRDEQHLCDLSGYISDLGLEGFGSQNTLTPSSIKYTIDQRTYFPSYSVDDVHDFVASTNSDQSHTRDSKRFFEQYAGNELFSVCRDGDSNSSLDRARHHAFHVDAKCLFLLPNFQKKLDAKLSELPPITHLVHNSKEADQLLASLIKERLDHEFQTIEVNSFRELRDEENFYEAFTLKDANILVLDAQAISGGSRLSKFQIALRELFNDLQFDGRNIFCQIHYVVGLARFDADNDLQKTRRFFPQSAPGSKEYLTFDTVEEVILPDWHENQCPWCREREILRAVMNDHSRDMNTDARRHIDKRLRRLSSPRGLQNDVFSRRYNSDNFEFHPGSFFLDKQCLPEGKELSEADLTCAVASALQTWRASTFTKPPANYVITCDVAFNPNMYNETMLRAAIWRSLRPREIAILNPNEEAEARNLLEGIFNSSELDKYKDREGDFVLGLEAALALGRKVRLLLGDESFKNIDWELLQQVADRIRPSSK